MKLTKKDRVILINQYRILAALRPDEKDHYEELITILENGYSIFYSQIDEWISNDMPNEKGRFVLDILDLYRAIEDVKRKNKKSSELNNNLFAIFSGFDGNYEAEYLSFARFLIEDQGKFAEQKPYFGIKDGYNSHMPMVEKYKKMIEKWKETGLEYNLTLSAAIEILNS